MGLQVYSAKRNFKNTPEPKGKKIKPGKVLEFVVQRHRASHLHYDFRLEMDGVMKSWAVPKGPSMNPKDKRLAMMVEDHPFDYRTFEGIIPEGNYGAGTVEIWDKGVYTSLNAAGKSDEKVLLKELAEGNIKFVMAGEKLKGEFALVKLKDPKSKNSWLLIKHRDQYAVDSDYSSEDYPSNTARKGKTFMKEKGSSKKKAATKKNIPKAIAQPSFRYSKKTHLENFIKPMKAKQTENPFDGDDWIFEIKWDGYRAIAETGKHLKFYSRNGISFINQYPEIAEELGKIRSSLVIDGEVVALDKKGNPDFQLLQNFNSGEGMLAYYVFDILEKDGKDLKELPLTERKSILQKSIKTSDVIRYADHIQGDGLKFFALIRKKNMEGIIAKRADSTYVPGLRTSDWLKIKNHEGQEAVIAGFTEPRKSRKFFGALVLGIYKGKKLIYCGHTGTGFNDKSLKTLHDLLIPLVQEQSSFEERIKTNMPVTWVRPELVCNVKYSEMTKDGIMRHPVFMGLRQDKEAGEVVNEKVTNMDPVPEPSSRKKIKSVVRKKPAEKVSVKKKGGDTEIKVGKQEVILTHLDKIYFPKEKITKGDIVNYYQSVSSYILPYLKDRPESLLRTPNGIAAPGFFHKDAGNTAPEWVKSEKIYSESNDKYIDYLVCNDAATLAYLNNLGCIEINPWHSRLDALDNPDYLAIDLDPSPENTFDEVVETAQVVKEVFDRAGAPCFCKTSGATGLHIYSPLGARYNYDQIKNFANIIAVMVSEMLPDTTSVIRPLKERGSKIYIDFLQNRRGQTLSSVYSARPKAGATVSTPLQWKEVKKGLHPSQFDIITVPKRLQKTGDIFSDVLGKGIDIKKCLDRLDA